MQAVLITGCAGFIGSHLAEYYQDHGYHVYGVDNFSTGMRSNAEYLKKRAPNAFTFFEKNISESWAWADDIPAEERRTIQFVFHLASPASPLFYQKMPMETLEANSTGLKNAIKFADGVEARVVFASTSEVYGDTSISPQSESLLGSVNSFGSRSCYTESKRFGEALIYSRNRLNGEKHGLVRIFNTYGPRMNPDDGRVVINFLVQALKGEAITIYGDGRQTRSFCYIRDLIAGLTSYAESEICTPINIGNDTENTILDLAQEVQSLFPEKNLPIKFLSLPENDPRIRRPDLQMARLLLHGWQPRVSLREGLLEMTKWLKQVQLP